MKTCPAAALADDTRGPVNPLVWYMAQGYPVAGGHEAHILRYATAIGASGFRTEVVIPDPLPRVEHRFLCALRERGIPIWSAGDAVALKAAWFSWFGVVPWMLRAYVAGGRPAQKVFRQYIRSRLCAASLGKRIQRERPDIIHVFGRLADNLWDVLPADRVVFHHGTEGIRDATWTDNEVEHFCVFCDNVARNFAPGAGVAENVKKHFGIQAKIETIFTICPDEACGCPQTIDRRLETGGNGGETGDRRLETGDWKSEIGDQKSEKLTSDLRSLTSEFRIGEHLRFGILCRFIPEKGIEDILAALALFYEKHGAVNFVFAGQGPLEAAIREETGDCRLQTADGKAPPSLEDSSLPSLVSGLPSPVSSRIRIERVTSPVDTLRNIDVFVHPSRSDAMPMAIAEALMCGTPCIVSRVGGIPDLVRDGEEGFLVDAGQPEQIVVAMERFAAMDRAELDEFRQRARARYEEKCQPEKVAAVVAQHYRDILRG